MATKTTVLATVALQQCRTCRGGHENGNRKSVTGGE